ncbi:hypothetical protein CV102_02435 [Natronococcus pandeyae]|uniref:DUF7322 domain-containing protein n=1 Tax=Natronococcus pandeyae TaxID=2055836 RepID=A0A8J8Q4K9_9EURY|nr:hypothetical protein [Natronococcus pandeyae]TYL40451.1 hypothetical protein CV102_02435 [Natronococcus pandeyae]
MVFDRSEHEPEEWDPEEEYADPDNDSLTIPRVATEDAGSDLRSEMRSELESPTTPEMSTTEADVSGDLLQAFWSIVLVVNAAVLALSLGVLFLIFEGRSTHSIALVGGGVILFGSAVRRYRSYRAADADSTTNGGDDATTNDDDDDTTTSGDDADDDNGEPPESGVGADAAQSPTGETNSAPQAEHRSSDDPDRT